MQELRDAEGMELDVYRTVSGFYRVDLIPRVAADVPVALLTEGKGTRTLEHEEDAGETYARVYPLGANTDGYRHTMAAAEWQITAIATNVLTLAGGPIAFPDQLNGLFVEAAADPTIRTEITATSYDNQTVTVASTTGLTVGAYIRLRRDNLGTQLTYVQRPDAVALYGGETKYAWRTPLELDQIPPIDNLVDNPYLDRWEERA